MTNDKNITAITIGGFDGMHLAHQELFLSLGNSGAIIVIDTGYATLTPKKYREEFTIYPIYYFKLDEIKHLSGKEFIDFLQTKFINLNKIVVGFDFYFGKNRQYCANDLKQLFKGSVEIVKEISLKDISIHSRIIREYIKKSEIATANKLLGHNYKIYGKQIKGQGLGAKAFVPTINLEIDGFLLPNEGVYMTKTILNNTKYNSVTFLGHRVSTDGTYAVETHILDKEITNDENNISIEFYEKLRDNMKFDSFEDLKLQILEDIENTKVYFSRG